MITKNCKSKYFKFDYFKRLLLSCVKKIYIFWVIYISNKSALVRKMHQFVLIPSLFLPLSFRFGFDFFIQVLNRDLIKKRRRKMINYPTAC